MTLPSINRSPGPRDNKLNLVRMRLKCKTDFRNIHKLYDPAMSRLTNGILTAQIRNNDYQPP
jgi:hypothetical protein